MASPALPQYHGNGSLSQVTYGGKGSRTIPVLCFSILAICAAILYCFNPVQFGFYPKCAFYHTTGLLCPGCGSLRALHQLLHGNLSEAVRFNAVLVLFLPVFLLYAAIYLVLRQWPFALLLRGASSGTIARLESLLKVRPLWLWIGFALLVLFGILRNLPFAHPPGWL